MGKARKKSRTHKKPGEGENPNAPKTPKTFVMRSGEVGHSVMGLVSDIRRVMEPNTATKLRERNTNRLRDFVAVAGPLGVTHFVILSRTDHGTNLRIARVPRGPTLSFQVKTYSLAKDIAAMQKSPKSPGSEFNLAPLLVLNNFGDSKELKLVSTVFQNMFPPINIQSMHLADARRVVLLNYNSETKHIDFRHYNVSVKPVGVSKSIKRVITTEVPDLQGFSDISEYVLRGAYASESDIEDGPESTVTLGQDYIGRNNRKQDQRAIKLVELGPRMELRLVKIQAGLCDGEVLYHDYIKRTPEEIKAQKVAREKKMQEKAARRKAQEVNVAKKKAEQEAAKEAHRIATGGAPRKAKDGDEDDSDNDNQDSSAKRKRGDDDDEDNEDGYGDESEDNYSDMGDMAPQFSDDEEAFSGEDHDQMEGLSDEDDLE
ncbi:MAG: Brix domain-containing protein [Benniella sp.]|nr:MAG: Brix domain-containing protein [Benniella sp.]